MMWLILTLLAVAKVISKSRGKSLRERFIICWGGTKMVLLVPALTMLAIMLVVGIYYIASTFPLPQFVITGIGYFSIAALILAMMLFIEAWLKWLEVWK